MNGQVALSIALWTIAGVLGVSGASKLFRPRDAADSMVQFGIIRRAKPVAGVFAGAVEAIVSLLAIAALASLVPVVAVGVPATALFALFSVLLARSLRRGETFKCNCFTTSGDQISTSGLARALGLMLLSVPLIFVSVKPAGVVQGMIGAAVLVGLWSIATQLYAMRHTNRDPLGNAAERWEAKSYEVKGSS